MNDARDECLAVLNQDEIAALGLQRKWVLVKAMLGRAIRYRIRNCRSSADCLYARVGRLFVVILASKVLSNINASE